MTRWLMLLALAACRAGGSGDAPTRTEASTPRPDPLPDPLPDRDPDLAHRLVADHGAVLLDVRTQQEFADGHLEGAIHIPYDELPARLDEIASATGDSKSTPIVVYCRSGRRASIAKETLQANGYGRVTNLGGMSDW